MCECKKVKVINIKRLPHAIGLPLPCIMTDGSSGADVVAAIDNTITINPTERQLIPTGLMLEIPSGYEIQVRPRSGLALKYGITVINSPGTVDSDYRGEVKVIIINHGNQPFIINRGDRIAQIVFAEVPKCIFNEVVDINDTHRGDGGFGHTG